MTFHKNDPVTVGDSHRVVRAYRGRTGVVHDTSVGAVLVRLDLRSGEVANVYTWVYTEDVTLTKRYAVGDEVTLTRTYNGNRPYLIGARGVVIRDNGGTAKPYSVKFETPGDPEFGWFTEAELEPAAKVVVEAKDISDDEHTAGIDAAILEFASQSKDATIREVIEAVVLAYRKTVDV